MSVRLPSIKGLHFILWINKIIETFLSAKGQRKCFLDAIHNILLTSFVI